VVTRNAEQPLHILKVVVADMIVEECGLIELLDFLRTRNDFTLTPFNLIMLLQRSSGISMQEGGLK
jgi:hypothetical protein